MPELLNIVTFNARGLRSVSKRRSLFRHFHRHYPDHIIVLQECHSSERDHPYWEAEWGSPIYLSHGPSTHEAGVAVLLPRSLTCDVSVVHNDNDGRLLVLQLLYVQCRIALIAVYAPTQGYAQQQNALFDKIKQKLGAFPDDEDPQICLVGDFNVHLSPLDVQGNRFRMTKPAQTLTSLLSENSLVDVWRERHANIRRYTWRKSNPIQGSRIDYAFVSQSLIDSYVMRRVKIKPCIHSDHSLVNLEISINVDTKGRGLFRFDNRLLDDNDFIQRVREEMQRANDGQGLYAGVADFGLTIEMLLSEIRIHSIKVSKYKAKRRREDYATLVGELDRCEKEMSETPTVENIERCKALQERLDQSEEEKGRLAMIRSGANWLEEGEKPTKYFLRLCARRNKEKSIQVLQRPDGEYVTGNREILHYCKEYFEEIYASRGVVTGMPQVAEFLAPAVCPRLSESDSKKCDGAISNEECETALKRMMNNKAPSVSGFTKEFFVLFWPDIGNLVTDYINQAREAGAFLSHSAEAWSL